MKNVSKSRVLVTRFPLEARVGGEEMHTLSLMQGLDKRGVEAIFLGSCPVLRNMFKMSGFEARRAWLGPAPVTRLGVIGFTLLWPVLFLLAGWQLWQARKRWGVNVLYCLSFGEKLVMTPWARLFGMKILWLEHARIGAWLARNPWRWVYGFFSRWVTVVVTSNAMVPHARKFARNVLAVPCGVIVDKVGRLPDKIVDFLKGGFAVGTVARLTVDKGVDMIVKLVHNKPDVRVVIVGKGPLRKKLEKLAGGRKQVMIFDSLPREQLVALYRVLDLFVLGSREMDPFGMVAAEAMWQGTPTVVTDACGIAADLMHERDAYIIRPKFAELDRAVKKLSRQKSLLERIGQGGQKFAKKNYALERVVDSFEDLLS